MILYNINIYHLSFKGMERRKKVLPREFKEYLVTFPRRGNRNPRDGRHMTAKCLKGSTYHGNTKNEVYQHTGNKYGQYNIGIDSDLVTMEDGATEEENSEEGTDGDEKENRKDGSDDDHMKDGGTDVDDSKEESEDDNMEDGDIDEEECDEGSDGD